jgi:hypothetical protein
MMGGTSEFSLLAKSRRRGDDALKKEVLTFCWMSLAVITN